MKGRISFSIMAAITALLIGYIAWLTRHPAPPDPRLVEVSVRSTLFALPSPTPVVIVETRVVEVTRIVEPPPSSTASTLSTLSTTSLTSTSVPTSTLVPNVGSAPQAGAAMIAMAASSADGAAIAESAQLAQPAPQDVPNPAPEPTAAPESVAVDFACPQSSDRRYDTIPIASAPSDHPDDQHGDLNLALRGWNDVQAALEVTPIDGPADADPPQFKTLFADGRLPPFVSAAQVFDWNWGCAEHGCRGDLLTQREVLLLGLGIAPGEPLTIPDRDAQIYGGGFKAMVLYAEPTRITLGYTRDDSVANGYVVHLEDLCVDANLLATYRAGNAAGRGSLPALRSGEVFGVASGAPLRIAIRDRGDFLDPRSRKDWWRGF
jgi:hypothetical protein